MVHAGVVGLGRIASTLEGDKLREKPCTHAGVLDANPNVSIVAGADLNERACRDFQTRWSVASIYPSLKILLAHHKVDLLHITTPPASHLKLLAEAYQHKVPVVVLEKPVTRNMTQAYRFLEQHRDVLPTLCKRVIVNHERRFARDYQWVRELILNEAYGRLLTVTAEFFTKAPIPSLDVLLHDGTHLMDAIFYLLEEDLGKSHERGLQAFLKRKEIFLPIRKPYDHNFHAHLTRRKKNIGETLQVNFVYDRSLPVPVTCVIGSGHEYFHFEIRLSFTHGRLAIGNGILKCERSVVSPYYEGFSSLETEKKKTFRHTKPFVNMLEHALALYHDPQKHNISSLIHGLLPLAFHDLVKRSLRAK